jgi:hypothetical protein
MGVQAGYYAWYLLLLCLPLSGFGFNGAAKLPIYGLYVGSWPPPLAWNICGVLAVLWALIVYYRVTAHIVTNLKLEGAFSVMSECTDLDDLKQRAARTFGLRVGRIRVVASDVVSSPISYGFVRKIILLPIDYTRRYSNSELYSLLLHEMAHIKNGDTAKMLLLRFAGCFLIFPPSFLHDFKRDTEILCDNRVMGAKSVDADTYTDLLVRECSGKATELKGLAFSDSFYAVKSRVDAIYSFPPRAWRLSVLAVMILLVLLAAFVRSCYVPAGWFISNHPADRKLDILVSFSEEEYWAIQMERSAAYDRTGIIPPRLPDRPDTTYFDGTYERLADGSVRIDRAALREAVLPLEEQGKRVEVICFSFYNYTLSSAYKRAEQYPIFRYELESFDEDAQPMIINSPGESYPLDEYMYTFAAHWL